VRTPDGYRFSLQFKILSDAHRQVGEFLESLGNKKSAVAVTAVAEYIKAHPEVLNRDNPIKVIAAHGYSEETLQARIRELIHQVAGTDVRLSAHTETDGALSEGQSNSTPENGAVDPLDVFLAALDQFE